MLNVTVNQAYNHIKSIINSGIRHPLFLWGAPGIGKSSVVGQVASELGMEFIDLRLSQLAPTDLRGLPFVEEGKAQFAPPNFLPTAGNGILFLDEMNLAPTAIQNVAMQLVLDRRVGDYKVPDDWFIIAAGNRAEDRAAVSQVPAPLANRFLHMTVEVSLEDWKRYAITKGVNEEIISFMNFRPQLLHDFHKTATAWPSPRTWDYADSLLRIGLGVESAVGEGAANEFYAYKAVYSRLPDVTKVLAGDMSIKVPKEPSLMYAVCGALVARGKTGQDYFNGLKWLIKGTTEDYIGTYMSDVMVAAQSNDVQGDLARLIIRDPEVKKFGQRYQELLR